MPEKPLSAILTPESGLIFRIVHRECIPWILDNGLHCRSSSVLDPKYRTIGLPELIDRRRSRRVLLPPGGTLSDYVPFYFTPRSVMLMNILTGRGVPSLPAEDIVVIVSSLPHLMLIEIPFLYTNQHAYPPRAEFSGDLSRLPELVDWSILQRSDFSHDPEDPGKKERYQAEALVWNQLPVRGIVGICCSSESGRQDLSEQIQSRGLTIPAHVEKLVLFDMITFQQGNLLCAPAEALVNTVNTVGVMGKGIALMFKEAYPTNYQAYEEACRRGDVRVGRVFVTEIGRLEGPRWIINFPTKKHWRQPSQLRWIVEGLTDLRQAIQERGIRSVALPPLGCGNGGLDWDEVRPEIERALSSLDDVEVTVFEPTEKYQNVAKRRGVEKLTPARALVAEMVRRYWVLGIECTNLEIQKLCWFLERVSELQGFAAPLNLDFQANRYGPYSDRLRHLLDGLDGSYLHCDKRLADAGPSDTIWFDEARRRFVDLYIRQPDNLYLLRVLDETAKLIDGFESPMGMELLATVDWLVLREGCAPTLAGIRRGLDKWPGGDAAAGARKQRLFKDRDLDLSLRQLAPLYSASQGSVAGTT